MIRIHACLVRVLHSILYIKEITINPVVLLASVFTCVVLNLGYIVHYLPCPWTTKQGKRRVDGYISLDKVAI
jgi:hypothetical protein